jgi:hypothetical protein
LNGCTFYGSFRDINAHEKWCDQLFCFYCEKTLTYATLPEHRCYGMLKFLYLLDPAKKEGYYIKPYMVENGGKLIEALTCALCSNILRKPQKCKFCADLFCEMCLEENDRY